MIPSSSVRWGLLVACQHHNELSEAPPSSLGTPRETLTDFFYPGPGNPLFVAYVVDFRRAVAGAGLFLLGIFTEVRGDPSHEKGDRACFRSREIVFRLFQRNKLLGARFLSVTKKRKIPRDFFTGPRNRRKLPRFAFNYGLRRAGLAWP